MKRLSFPHRLVLAVCLSAIVVFSAAAAPVSGHNPAAPIVHLISIGDSDVGDIGKNVAEDARNTVAAFEQAFAREGRSHQLNSMLILGEDVREAVILQKIAALNVRPQDTIVLLYSGHGISLQRDQHAVSFHHDPGLMRRADLLAALKAKNARLTVLLTDVCSGYRRGSEIPVAPSVSETQPRRLSAGSTIDWRTIDCLFLSHSGMVDITAAEPGYNARTSFPSTGSHFTNAFLEILKAPHSELVGNLDRDRDGAVQWDEFLPQLRGDAAQRDLRPAGDRSQQAYAWSLGRWTPPSPTTTTVGR